MSGKEDELLRLATLSGTPGFLTFAAHGERTSPKLAAMHDLEWRRGVKALYGETQLDLACSLGDTHSSRGLKSLKGEREPWFGLAIP